MIITIDVGNTNITVGVFNGDEIVASFRMTTKMPRTSDEYGMLLTDSGCDYCIGSSECHAFLRGRGDQILKHPSNRDRAGNKNGNPYRHRESTSDRCRPYRGRCGSL